MWDGRAVMSPSDQAKVDEGAGVLQQGKISELCEPLFELLVQIQSFDRIK